MKEERKQPNYKTSQRVVLFEIEQDLKLALQRVKWVSDEIEKKEIDRKSVDWINKAINSAIKGLDSLDETFE